MKLAHTHFKPDHSLKNQREWQGCRAESHKKKDRQNMKLIAIILSLLVLGTILYNRAAREDNATEETLTQFSTIDALMSGVYDGELTLADLKQYGDFGLGTFNGVDGEMIVVDSHIYQISSDGKAAEPDLATQTPFAAVTFFEADWQVKLGSGVSFDSLTKKIDEMIPTPNIFYAIRMTGSFERIRTRSIPKQSPPYKPLAELVATQPTFNFENVTGTIVGFRCPPYAAGVNVPGYHFHFLTEDGQSGGHVLELAVAQATLEIDDTPAFSLILPKNAAFYKADLTSDQQAALQKVER